MSGPPDFFPLGRMRFEVEPGFVDNPEMFTVYGYGHGGQEDGHVDAFTMPEALTLLRELVEQDAAILDGTTFARYFLSFETDDVAHVLQWLRAQAP